MRTIEMFDDTGLNEEEINKKYPELTFNQKIKDYLKTYKNQIIVGGLIFIILIYLLNRIEINNKILQSGGNPMEASMDMRDPSQEQSVGSKIMSPMSSTFGMVTTVLGKFLKLLLFLVMIILVPTVPVLLYCLLAYYVIRRFLVMFTRLK